jgi:hypothetical protein
MILWYGILPAPSPWRGRRGRGAEFNGIVLLHFITPP